MFYLNALSYKSFGSTDTEIAHSIVTRDRMTKT